jgi:hypothetical protein
MKKSIILQQAIVPILTLLLSASPASAESLAPKEHSFRVELPGPPRHKEQSRSIGIGTVTSENFIVQNSASTYFVSVITIPGFASTFTPDSILFGQTRDGMLDDVKGTQISFEDFEVDGHEGKLLVYEMSPPDKPKQMGKAEFFRMGKKMYLFASHGILKDAPERDAFFQSVQLTD